MRFSIILPVFNREKSVSDAIHSVINQRFSDWELVIIDDGSQDQTYEVCKKLASKDNRIQLRHQTNQGVSAARNHGLRIASGEYILFLDSDDLLKQNALELLDETIQSCINPDLICFGCCKESGYSWKPDSRVCDILFHSDAINSCFLPDHLNLVPHEEYFMRPFVTNKCFKAKLIEKKNIR